MPVSTEPRAAATAVENADPMAALDEAVAAVRAELGDAPVTLAMLFAGFEYEPEFPALVRAAKERLGAQLLIGCSGEGVIGPNRELERTPALALATHSLPDAAFRAVHLDMEALTAGDPSALVAATGVAPDEVKGWILLADPYTVDSDLLVERFSAAYGDVPILGGMASSLNRGTQVFLNDEAYRQGFVALAITAPYALRPVVSQGASPIGRPWTITGAHDNIVESIGGRPAYEVLRETIFELPEDVQQRARSAVLVGLAMDEYRDELVHGDFLIRNLLGYNQESGVIAIAAQPRIGQTLQFQFRDAQAADEDLRSQLQAFDPGEGEVKPVAALLCSCNGRGRRMFESPDHDARVLNERFAGLPVAGLFCSGEIGSVGKGTFVHGFTASIGLIVRESSAV